MAIRDIQHQEVSYRLSEREHHYGSNIHILKNPYYESLLAKFSQASTPQAKLFEIARKLTDHLLVEAVNHVFPRANQVITTRMGDMHPEGSYEAQLLDATPKAVVVDLMRAGILPSQEVFERLHDFLPDHHIRQDHILLNRKKSDTGEVVGVEISGYKVGGSVENSFVFFPDPMGATGGSLKDCVLLYKKTLESMISGYSGKAKKFIALHFIITPEYLDTIKDIGDELEVFALRLDRGLSSDEVLNSPLGQLWDKEVGLNDQQYIVPGAGGIGEVLNNSFEEE